MQNMLSEPPKATDRPHNAAGAAKIEAVAIKPARQPIRTAFGRAQKSLQRRLSTGLGFVFFRKKTWAVSWGDPPVTQLSRATPILECKLPTDRLQTAAGAAQIGRPTFDRRLLGGGGDSPQASSITFQQAGKRKTT